MQDHYFSHGPPRQLQHIYLSTSCHLHPPLSSTCNGSCAVLAVTDVCIRHPGICRSGRDLATGQIGTVDESLLVQNPFWVFKPSGRTSAQHTEHRIRHGCSVSLVPLDLHNQFGVTNSCQFVCSHVPPHLFRNSAPLCLSSRLFQVRFAPVAPLPATRTTPSPRDS